MPISPMCGPIWQLREGGLRRIRRPPGVWVYGTDAAEREARHGPATAGGGYQ